MIEDNQDVAVFTRLNDLAQRHGLKPYDFVASFMPEDKDQGTTYVLTFEVPASGNALREERFDKMLASIGADTGSNLEQCGQHVGVDIADPHEGGN